MPKKTVNILLTCVNSAIMPSIASLINNHPDYDIKLFGVDTVPLQDNLGNNFCNVCYQVPPGTEQSYIPAMKKIVVQNNINLIFIGSDEECLQLSRHKEEFDEIGCKVCCSEYDAVSLASNKYLLLMKLKDQGIYTGNVHVPKTSQDIKLIAHNLGYPEKDFVIKPQCGRGSRGFKVVSRKGNRFNSFYDRNNYYISLNDLIDIFSRNEAEISNFLMMEYYPGDKYSADILITNGSIKSMVIRNNGPSPKIDPPTQFADIVYDEDVRDYVESIVDLIGFDYFVQVEVGRTLDNNPGLIEINTRLDATLPITMGINQNFFHEMISYGMTGRMSSNFDSNCNNSKQIRFRRYWQHMFEELSNCIKSNKPIEDSPAGKI